MTDLSSRQIPQKAGELVERLGDSAQQIHQITSDIAKPDQAGMSAGANIRSSLINVNAATGNLVDVTEAAKHNFLLRGFFNKRGYYSLADISPERYRRDGAFTNRSNRRIWLSGSELFQNGSNGEELSERGKALLHAAVTQHGESGGRAPSSSRATQTAAFLPMSSGSPAAEPWWSGNTSRSDSRSIQRISESADESAPPKELGRASWDGVCVVVVSGS